MSMSGLNLQLIRIWRLFSIVLISVSWYNYFIKTDLNRYLNQLYKYEFMEVKE